MKNLLAHPPDARALAAIVFVIALLAYLPSIRNRFAYDDHVAISLDERMHDLSRAPDILSQTYWHDPALGLYRPLTSLTFALDWAMGGGSPHWFHFMNTLWNAIAVTLAFLVLATFTPALAAFAGAVVFAVHPVHVEAVANVVGRAEVLTAVFSLGAMLMWCRSPAHESIPRRRATAIVLLYAAAMMSKESGIMLPALLALCDLARRSPLASDMRRWIRTHSRILIAMSATAAVYLAARSAVIGSIGPGIVDPTLDVATSTSARVMTALQAWPQFMRLLLFPKTLLSDYGPPILMPALVWNAPAFLGALILGVLVIGGLVAWRTGANRTAAVLLFLPVAMLPTSNLLVPIGVIVAERTLYLPSIALAMAVAFALAETARVQPYSRIAIGVVVVIVSLMTVRTLTRIPVWRNTTAVFAALQRDRPDSYRLHGFLARVAANENRPSVALAHYAQALRTWPYDRAVTFEAAGYAAGQGDLSFTDRVTHFAVARWPDDVAFLRMRAGVQLDLGDMRGAATTLRHALALAPGDTTLNAMYRAVQLRTSQ